MTRWRTYPSMMVAVEGPTLHVARTQPAQLFPNSYVRNSERFCSLPDSTVQDRTLNGSDETKGRRQPDRRSNFLQQLVAKPKSLRKFLLIVIKVNQIGIVFGMLSVNPQHHQVHRSYAANRACHMPHADF
jgi:hypothetical protein